MVYWSSNHGTRASLPSAALSLVAAFAVLLLSRLEHSRSIRPSFLLSVYLFASAIFDAVQARTLFLRHDRPEILGLFTASIGIRLVLLVLESTNKRRYLKAPYCNYSPEATCGIFNRSVFFWINPLLAVGFRKLIALDDLYETDPSLKSAISLDEMQGSWSKCKLLNTPPFLY